MALTNSHLPPTTTVSFLDLAPETRLQIYEFFEVVPTFPQSDADRLRKNAEIARTRYSLQLVSRGVKLDFAPFFWRSTTLAVHGTIRPCMYHGIIEIWNSMNSLRRSPSDFDARFMSQNLPHIFANVRKICCEIPVASEEYTKEDNDTPAKATIRLDVDGILRLATTLRQKGPNLPLLEEVTLARRLARPGSEFTATSNDWNVVWKESCDPMQAQDFDEVEKKFSLYSYDRPLEEWSITRRMQYEQYGYSDYTVQDKELVLRKSSQSMLVEKAGWAEFPGGHARRRLRPRKRD